jgi:hypothetical protein
MSESAVREVRFEVLGTPAPKGSSRAILIAGLARNVPSGSDVNRKRLRSWDVNVREAALAAVGGPPPFIGVALDVFLRFALRRPAGHYGKRGLRPSAALYPTTKPDCDKIARATLDSLTGIVFDDDSRIVRLLVYKLYASPVWPEGATISVTALEQPDDRRDMQAAPAPDRLGAAEPHPSAPGR